MSQLRRSRQVPLVGRGADNLRVLPFDSGPRAMWISRKSARSPTCRTTASPIQIGTEGVYATKPFVVVGRIIYEYEQGGWNEWHIVFNDGTSGWLSDAQLEYVISFLSHPPGPLPAAGRDPPRTSVSVEWRGV